MADGAVAKLPVSDEDHDHEQGGVTPLLPHEHQVCGVRSSFRPPPPVTHATRCRSSQSLMSRIDWRLLPLLNLLYITSYLDRANLGNAHQFLNKDLGLTELQYSTCMFCSFEALHDCSV
jgi:hypothetical protein